MFERHRVDKEETRHAELYCKTAKEVQPNTLLVGVDMTTYAHV